MRTDTNKKNNRHFFSAIIAGALCGMGVLIVQAQTFDPPPTAAPDMAASFGDFSNLADYLKLDSGSPTYPSQVVASPLSLSLPLNTILVTLGRSGAPYSSTDDQAAILASSGTVTPPALSSLGIAQDVGVYAYAVAQGSDPAYGVFGYGIGAGSVGVAGKTASATGYAGMLRGAVKVADNATTGAAGSVTVADIASSPRFIANSAVAGTPALDARASIAISGGQKQGISVTTSDYYGVYGYSSNGMGYASYLTTSDYNTGAAIQGLSGNHFVGIRGIATASAASGTGAYGYSSNATSGYAYNGIEGAIGASATTAVAEGVSGAATTGIGVQARGSAFAFVLEGDLRIASGGKVYIGPISNPFKPGINEGNISAIINWCRSGGTFYCPSH